MPNLLDNGATWLRNQLQVCAGTIISYKRDHVTATNITATRGQSEADDFDDNELPIVVRYDDFLIDPEDLVLNGVLLTPERGDLISIGEKTYRVSPIGSGPCWRKSGSFGKLIRIHTREVN